MLSDRIQRIEPSITLAITAKAGQLRAAGENVLSFGAGEPDFDTPEPIKQAAIRAITEGKTKYTPVDGIPQLKAAIAARLKADHGLEYTADQIVATVGAKQAIFNLLLAAVNPGDGVLIPSPYWVSYPEMVRFCGGEPQFVPTHAEDGFRLRATALAAAIDSRSKILILNSPNNPTGAALEREELEAIAEVVLKHNLWVISDEIYEKLIYDGFRQVSFAAIGPEVAARTVIVNGVSKAYAMTGWRLGYMAGVKTWVQAAAKLQGQSTSNPTSITQWAAVTAFGLDDSVLAPMVSAFRERRDRLVDGLNAIDGIECNRPQGAFYVFPRVEGAMQRLGFATSMDFATGLLEQAKVALVPGEGFGAPGFVRLSYACSMEDIENGIARIAEFCRGG